MSWVKKEKPVRPNILEQQKIIEEGALIPHKPIVFPARIIRWKRR